MTCENGTEHQLAGEESYTDGIVRVMAVAHDTDPTALPPVYEAIDPDALEAVLTSLAANAPAESGTVEFAYDDHTVTVESSGAIHLAPD